MLERREESVPLLVSLSRKRIIAVRVWNFNFHRCSFPIEKRSKRWKVARTIKKNKCAILFTIVTVAFRFFPCLVVVTLTLCKCNLIAIGSHVCSPLFQPSYQEKASMYFCSCVRTHTRVPDLETVFDCNKQC